MNGIRTGLIYGSVRQGRFCDTVAEWVVAEVSRIGGFSLNPIDPRHLWGIAVPPGRDALAGRRTVLREQIEACDAFIVASTAWTISSSDASGRQGSTISSAGRSSARILTARSSELGSRSGTGGATRRASTFSAPI